MGEKQGVSLLEAAGKLWNFRAFRQLFLFVLKKKHKLGLFYYTLWGYLSRALRQKMMKYYGQAATATLIDGRIRH